MSCEYLLNGSLLNVHPTLWPFSFMVYGCEFTRQTDCSLRKNVPYYDAFVTAIRLVSTCLVRSFISIQTARFVHLTCARTYLEIILCIDLSMVCVYLYAPADKKMFDLFRPPCRAGAGSALPLLFLQMVPGILAVGGL